MVEPSTDAPFVTIKLVQAMDAVVRITKERNRNDENLFIDSPDKINNNQAR